eukprot:5732945-Alexandrium_andersonii.AAC.1
MHPFALESLHCLPSHIRNNPNIVMAVRGRIVEPAVLAAMRCLGRVEGNTLGARDAVRPQQ